MSKLTAHDVRELSEAIREIAAWNATGQKRLYLSLEGPFDLSSVWNVGIVSFICTEYAGEGETLGDAVKMAMKAWKEARDG